MVNYNGNVIASTTEAMENNRAFLYGDAVFETMKIYNKEVLFWEDHYFRLMSSMRILRMEIPMEFTMEYLHQEIFKLVDSLPEKTESYRVRLTCFRDSDGLYLPNSNSVKFLITASPLKNALYTHNKQSYEVELYKDFYVSKQLLSTLKTTNRLLNITASIFAKENGYDNCLLINDEKNVIEAINGNIFLVKDQIVVTPPVNSGCINGIMRKQILEILKSQSLIAVEEREISPFELQKVDEIFLTNVILGVQSVTKYRKKEYTSDFAEKLVGMLNAKVKFS